MDKQDKLVFDILNRLEDIDVSNVHINDVSKNKKIKRKNKKDIKPTVIKLGSGLELIGEDQAVLLNFDEIPKGRNIKKRERLEEWITVDFVSYIQDLYYKVSNSTLMMSVPAACQQVKRVRDELYELTGNTTNRIVRDFILFFFENHMKRLLREQGDFYFKQMLDPEILELFHNSWSYKNSIEKENKISLKDFNQNNILIENEIEKSHMLSVDNLIYKYGIIIAINWLIIKGIEGRKSIKMALQVCFRMYKNDIFYQIKESTERYSPYPDYLVFKKLDLFLSKIDENLKFNIQFTNSKEISEKFNFLRII